MKVANNILELVGSTPMLKLNKVTRYVEATVLAKVEFLNPSGSVKDRIAVLMIEAAEKAGILKPGSIIVEPTSGNTGIGLAMVAAVKGYRMVVVMPESMSMERRKIMKAFGAEIVLTPGGDMEIAVKKAEEMARKNPRVFLPQQFKNPVNPETHRETTGQEIIVQTGGKVDALVAGIGTGGTLTGVAEALKKVNPDVKIVAVEPAECSVLTPGGKCGSHKIEGIGDGFIPQVLRIDLINEVITPTSEEAYDMARRLAREEGILAGPSSGANVFAALKVAKELGKGKVVVTLLPDSGQRYLSTELFE